MTEPTRDANRPPVSLDNSLYYGKTKPGASLSSGRTGAGHTERLEQVCLLVVGDPGTEVAYPNLGVDSDLGGLDFDGASNIGIFDRIAQEVSDHLLDFTQVSADRQRILRQRGVLLTPLFDDYSRVGSSVK